MTQSLHRSNGDGFTDANPSDYILIKGSHGQWNVFGGCDRLGEVRPDPDGDGWTPWWRGSDGVCRPVEMPLVLHSREEAARVVAMRASKLRREAEADAALPEEHGPEGA
jgi:hypothetical protein